MLDPEKLSNPDLDIRYLLPELLEEKSKGLIKDNGFDYLDDEVNTMLIFLKTGDFEKAMFCVEETIKNVALLGNDLKQGVVVAIEKESGVKDFEIIRRFN